MSLVGCIAHHRYDHHVDAPVTRAVPALLVQVIDARDGGRALAAPSAIMQRELEEVRDAVGRHAVALALVPEGPNARAPLDAEDLRITLRAAAERGDTEVVFVRLHTARVYLSASISIFEVLAVDPRSRELLFGEAALSTHRQDPSPFDDQGAILHDTMRRAVGDLFGDLLDSRRAGHPHRRRADDLTSRVLDRPLASLEGGRVVGPRFSFEHLAGWELTGDLGSAIAGMRAPDGAYVSVVLEPTHQTASDYGASSLQTLAEVATVITQRPCVVDGHPAMEIESRFRTGHEAIQRITSADGIGFVVSCVARAPGLGAHRAECLRVLDSVRFSTAELASGQPARPPLRVLAARNRTSPWKNGGAGTTKRAMGVRAR